jgi:phage tail sheath protein FI
MPDRAIPGAATESDPSGPQVITGVETSIAAFSGRATRGTLEGPTLIHSFAEFEQVYGGLSTDSTMSYAVRDFFTNGGRQAVIQRLYRVPPGEENPVATLAPGGLRLQAASPGVWGRNLVARVVPFEGTSGPETPGERGRAVKSEDRFNLEVSENGADGAPVYQEAFQGLSTQLDAGERRVDQALATASRLVRLALRDDGSPDLPDGNPVEMSESAVWSGALGGADSAELEDQDYQQGFARLDQADLVNLLCIPPDRRDGWTSKSVYQAALTFCVRRRAMLIVDPHPVWCQNLEYLLTQTEGNLADEIGLSGPEARNAALYFPRVLQPDPLNGNQLQTTPPCGVIAGIMARVDLQRGVWKAPAGAEATLIGVQGLELDLGDRENRILNPWGINCLRSFPGRGSLVWGARTLRGADTYADDFKYVPVRRLALFIEESLARGTQWAIFEPNDEPLWAQIRLQVYAFLLDLFLQGAFQGSKADQAFFVKCGADTMSQEDIEAGTLIIEIGIATVKPAEFVILKFQGEAGRTDGSEDD